MVKKEWPAPAAQIAVARDLIKTAALHQRHCLIVPDKDADGLTSALIVYRTLELLGLDVTRLHLHFLKKGTSVHTESERSRLEETIRNVSIDATPEMPITVHLFIVDQGSRPAPPVVRPSLEEGCGKHTKVETLIIDHHQSLEWPVQSHHVTACQSPPISTSSLLTYLICYSLHPSVPTRCDWLAVVGIFGDLGPSEIDFGKSKNDWPVRDEMYQLAEAVKIYGKKSMTDAVSLLNAPRRTAAFNDESSSQVASAWNALFKAQKPSDILKSQELEDCRFEVNQEVERCTHTAPKFSKDGRVALLRINSAAQVHPVIATRWSGTLKGAKKLQCIMVCNPGHHPDPNVTSFSCRLANTLRKLPESERPSLRDLLKEYARKTAPDFLERVGSDFATGHNEATGGIIPIALFEEFAEKGMEIGVPDPDSPAEIKKRKAAEKAKGQTNLNSFFSSSPSPKKKVKLI